jgi:hypothetical protein
MMLTKLKGVDWLELVRPIHARGSSSSSPCRYTY